SLGGDTICVDVARMYFGSTPQSIIYLNNDITTSAEVLKNLADSCEASKYIVSREPATKEHDPSWGTLESQRVGH
ncbi:hypothetical protein EBT25_19060, partial [bacterium]|nr:hypothetical protein [bacterium]